MQNKKITTYIFCIILIVLVASTLRIYKLGEWNFVRDEFATLLEDAAFFKKGDIADLYAHDIEAFPSYEKLAKAVILSYGLHHFNYSLFGRDEFGARVLPTIFGILSITCVYITLNITHGFPIALCTSLILAIWPYHLYFSQMNRMYSFVFFFVTALYMLGSLLLEKPTLTKSILFGLAGIGIILSHPGALPALPAALFALFFAAFLKKSKLPKSTILILLFFAMSWLSLYLFYTKPFIGDNWGVLSGYENNFLKVIKITLKNLEWPFVVLASFGLLVWVSQKRKQDLYWFILFLGWVSYVSILPYILHAYWPRYMFPLVIPVFVAIGTGIGTLYEAVNERFGQYLSTSLIILIPFIILPSLISYYSNGNRFQPRESLEYVASEILPGDKLVAQFPPNIIRYYFRNNIDKIIWEYPSADTLDKIINEKSTRLWIVVVSDKGIHSTNLQTWLSTKCFLQKIFGGHRYDDKGFRTDVYLYNP